MMLNQEIAYDLYGYLGIEPGNGLPDTDAAIRRAMQAGLQKIYTKGPPYLREQDGACVLQAPQQVTFTVTQGSTVISGLTNWNEQMRGCVVRLSGELGDNVFIDQNTLLVPISQSNGTVSGTLYSNCFTLPPGVTAVSGDVFLDGYRELSPLFYEENQVFKESFPHNHTRAYDILQNSFYLRLQVGIPVGYFVKPCQIQVGPNYLNQIKVWPLPGSIHTLTWKQKISAPKLALSDLEIGVDNPTKVVPLPGDLHETAWLPLARMALSAYPHFLEAKRAYVAQEAADALGFLEELTPQPQTGAQLRPSVRLPN